MNPMRIVLAAGAVILAGMGTATAQTVIVGGGWGPPAFVVAPPPVFAVPVVPGPVFVAPAPAFAAPVVPAPRWHRRVIVTETNGWGVDPGFGYSDW